MGEENQQDFKIAKKKIKERIITAASNKNVSITTTKSRKQKWGEKTNV